MTCNSYVGVTCVNGNCPLAFSDEYAERGIPLPRDCVDCYYNKGCEDCALSGTEYCDYGEDGVKNG